MGLWTNLEIYQVEDLEINDLPALNDKLMNQGSGTLDELYSDDCVDQDDWEGPFRQGTSGELEIYYRSDGGCEGYGQETAIWSCYGDQVFQAIADAMIAGKLVFYINCEEPSYNEYFVLTPGNVKQVSEASMKPSF